MSSLVKKALREVAQELKYSNTSSETHVLIMDVLDRVAEYIDRNDPDMIHLSQMPDVPKSFG